MEVANQDDASLLLFSDVASLKASEAKGELGAVLHIDLSSDDREFKQTQLVLGTSENEKHQILDVEVWDTYLAVLVEKNTVFVFDLAKSASQETPSKKTPLKPAAPNLFHKPIFKACFADATEQVS